jgi:TonB-linked SusC/RagA family outer membrane protein
MLLLFVMVFYSVQAQVKSLTGKVTSLTDGQPLIGVSVSVKGATSSTITDADGNFKINIPEKNDNVLVIKYLGFKDQEVPVRNQTQLNVTLEEDTKALEEIVVVGYGTVKKRDLTGSVVSVKGTEIAEVPSASIIESVQGKIAGVDIVKSNGSATSGVSITVRGNRSITANNGPLFIVDGVQYSSIQDINPNDIESMEVLKDASSTAIYGSRGANGVIIITTKKGATGKASVSFNGYTGLSTVARYPSLLNLDQFVNLRREAFRATNKWNSPADDANAFNNAELEAISKGQYLDYHDLLIHNGLLQDYQMGVNAGTEKTKIYFSLGFLDEKGILKQDWSNRYSGRLNIDQSIGKIFKAGMQAQLTRYEQSIRRDPLNQANKVNPLGTIYDDNGNFIVYPLGGAFVSPLADEQPNVYSNRALRTRTLTNAYIEITPSKELNFRSTLGANIDHSRGGTYAAATSIDRNGAFPRATYNADNGFLINLENVLTYQKQISDHSVTLTGVNSFIWNRSDFITAAGENQLLKSQLFYALGNANSNIAVNTGYEMSNLVSFAGRANYSYKGKYLLALTGRTDGSSILSEGNKWAFFPSVAAAWRISDEDFFGDSNVINELKLRASYGRAGNYAVDPYDTQSSLSRVAFAYDNTSAPGYTFSPQVGNPNLGWELTTTLNLGLDIGLINNRVNATLDFYDSQTTDLLLARGLPPTTGVTTVVQNIGRTQNRGFEVGINSENLKGKALQWTSSLSFTKNKEKLVELVTANDDIGNGWFIGHPTSVFYDYEKIGIWQLGQEAEAAVYGQKPGDIRVRDLNNDNKIDATNDRKVVGTPRPDWYGGFDNTFKYKGFELNFYLFARFGQTINPDFLRRYDPQAIGQSTAAINYWTPENPSNDYPRPNSGLSLASMLYSSTIGYVDGSYLRVRNISLAYNIPKRFTQKTFLNNVKVYATAKNPFTYTKSNRLDEYDPERGGSENFPMTKLYVFGLNVGF